MTNEEKQEALDILIAHQKWRKGCDETPPTDPKKLSLAMDCAISALNNQPVCVGGDLHDE